MSTAAGLAPSPEISITPPSPEAATIIAPASPEVSKDTQINKSIGQFAGEKFSKPTDKPQETIQQLSDYDLAADRADIVKHLRRNNFTDDEIAVHLSKMKMGEGGVSNVVLEQQKERKLQTQAAQHSTENRMSPTVRAQQEALGTRQVDRNPKPTETPLGDTSAYDSLIAQADDSQLEKYAALKRTGFQEYLAKKAQEKLATKTKTSVPSDAEDSGNVPTETSTPLPENTEKPVEKPVQPAQPESTPALDRNERVKQYVETALMKRDKTSKPQEADFNGNTLEYKKAVWAWNGEQAKIIQNIETDAQVIVDMEDWEKSHQAPDPDKDPLGFAKWNKQAETHRQSLEKKYKGEKTKDTEKSPSAKDAIDLLQNDPAARALAQELTAAMQQQKDAKTDAEKQAAIQAQKAAEDKDPKKSKSILALLGLLGFVGITSLKQTIAQAG